MEEANCHPRAWIRQRSRWLKGYAITWATHMRNPARLIQDLGICGFLGFQVLFLGALTSYLTAPFLWGLFVVSLGFGFPLTGLMPAPFWVAFFGTMFLSQLIFYSVAIAALADRPRRHLLKFIPTLGLYFPLGALAAYKAFGELLRVPFYWDKTRHGL